MKITKITILFLLTTLGVLAQEPCEKDTIYNQFDFWIGEWTVYDLKNNIAGNSKISKILDNCVVLEEWTSANKQPSGLIYSGKSYNTYDANAKQWQQTWVDNIGGSTEFLFGKYENNSMEFLTNEFQLDKNTKAIRKLTFFKLKNGYVRQLGEISKDKGATWTNEYDLEYRRDIRSNEKIVSEMFEKLMQFYFKDDFENLTSIYSKKGIIKGYNNEIIGRDDIFKYWKNLKEKLGGIWNLKSEYIKKNDNMIWVKGTSTITDLKNIEHKVNFTLILIQEDNTWKIFQDTYW